VKAQAAEFGKHEAEHVETLKLLIEQLGGKADPAPAAKFNVRSQDEFLKAAAALEDLGVGAYNGLAPQFTTPDIVQAAGSIVQVEARHAAALRFRSGEDPAPNAFDPVLTPSEVQAAARKLSNGG
jgi:hypothetical protein